MFLAFNTREGDSEGGRGGMAGNVERSGTVVHGMHLMAQKMTS